MDKKALATYYHNKGFNCAQSVFAAFSDATGISPELSLTVAGGFGGGLRKGEVCGAASGGVMAIGAIFPFSDEKDSEAKAKIGRLAAEFVDSFRAKCGAVEEGISKRLCPGIIENAVEAVEEILAKEGK